MELILRLIVIGALLIVGSGVGALLIGLLVNAFDPPLDGNTWEQHRND